MQHGQNVIGMSRRSHYRMLMLTALFFDGAWTVCGLYQPLRNN